jgi:hypothetical protein
VEIQLALVGIAHRLANISREVGLGKTEPDLACGFLDGHDALQGVLGPLAFLQVTGKMQYLVTMARQKSAAQGEKCGRNLVMDAMTGGTQGLVGSRRGIGPTPATLVKHRTAFRAHGGFLEFQLCMIGIVLPFLEQSIMPRYVFACHGDFPSFGGKATDQWTFSDH